MLHLRSLDVGPPGGWRFVEPATGVVVTAITFASLVGKAAQHRQNMQIPADPEWRLDEIVENSVCEALSPADRMAYCETGVRQRSAVGWREVLSFLKTAVSWVATGAELVTQEEAERRANICAGCPLNVSVGGCAPCRVTVEEFRTTVLQRSTSHDAGLQACGVCGCELKTAVHLPLENLRAGKPHLTFPEWCWQKQ